MRGREARPRKITRWKRANGAVSEDARGRALTDGGEEVEAVRWRRAGAAFSSRRIFSPARSAVCPNAAPPDISVASHRGLAGAAIKETLSGIPVRKARDHRSVGTNGSESMKPNVSRVSVIGRIPPALAAASVFYAPLTSCLPSNLNKREKVALRNAESVRSWNKTEFSPSPLASRRCSAVTAAQTPPLGCCGADGTR